MNGENIPVLAYFFVGVTSLVLAYVTYSDEIDKLPGQIKDSMSSTNSSLTNTVSSNSTSSDNSSGSSNLNTLNPLARSEEKTEIAPNVTGGKRKHKKTKRHHSKSKHNKSKHNKSKK
jgi:hypothetical protein